MVLQIPKLKIEANTKLIVFLSWALYGVVPTLHWTIIMGGLENDVVQVVQLHSWMKFCHCCLLSVTGIKMEK